MEVFTMLKFWKTTSKVAAATTTTITSSTENSASKTATHSTLSDHFTEESDDDNDDDDSYFELELTLPPHNSKPEEKPKLSSNPRPKPQSPISVIRAASPKLPVFMFGRLAAAKKSSKRSTNKRFEDFSDTDSVSERCYYSPRRISNDSTSSFTVKFKIEDGSIVPKFTRSRSSSSSSTSTVFTSPKIESRNSVDEFPETSKRFAKYLNLMIPKSMKKNIKGERFGSCSPARCSATPLKEKQSRFLVKCKRLAKSKSASAVVGVSSPANFPARNDFPVDGIEGAILHCKCSLKGNTSSNSSLSRCSSDPSHEKSIQVSEQI